jgi:N-acetylneuraminate synthase
MGEEHSDQQHHRANRIPSSSFQSPSSMEIAVCGRMIGDAYPAFIVAEGACNHMCDMSLAYRMIDQAVEAAVDAIKFQTYKAEKLARQGAKLYWEGRETSQLEYYRRLDRFGRDEYEKLFQYARAKGIIAFSTPFDVESASMLNDLGMPLFKIASCDLPDFRLLRHVARFHKPVILSTGGSTEEEIDKAVAAIQEEGNHQLILLACVLSYPTAYRDANLLRIRKIRGRYPDFIVGLSDHTPPDAHMIIPSLGVCLGAKVIEKHYTLDRTMTGSGHFFSVNPDDLKKMVENIRLAETVLGNPALGASKAEEAARANARRSIVADRPIHRGEIITSSMIGMKRPADGLEGFMLDKVIGKRARFDIAADQTISLDMLE